MGLLIRRRFTRALAFVLAAAVPAAGIAAPPGHIRFTAENLVTTAEGEFHAWHILRAVVDETDPTRSRVELEVMTESLDTANHSRDEHLRSPDFFDVERFPTARVTLEGFRLDEPDAFTADVTLGIRDRSKTFPMRFRIEDRAARRIKGSVTLDRRDFGLGEPYSRWVPLSIKNEVVVQVETTVPAASETAATP